MSFNQLLSHRVLRLALAGALCLLGLCAATQAAESKDDRNFLRIQRDDRQEPSSLETAIVRYVPRETPANSPTYVDLVGAVHVGERAYYEELNRRFQGYDAVLYELVAPTDANVPRPGQRSGHPVGILQVAMKDLLELDFQLDRVDYRKRNFVHADLTPDEFRKSMEDRSESFTKMFFRMMGQGLAQQSKDPGRSGDLAIFSALFSKDRAIELKRAMALQFEEMEQAAAVLDGPDGSTIITERNRRALEVLKSQLEAGKSRLAIFYGAAHLPDFDQKLRADMGFVPTSTDWLVAWDLQRNRSAATKRERASK